MVGDVHPRHPFCAHPPPAVGMLRVRPHVDQPAVLGVADDAAAGVTVETGRGHSLSKPARGAAHSHATAPEFSGSNQGLRQAGEREASRRGSPEF